MTRKHLEHDGVFRFAVRRMDEVCDDLILDSRQRQSNIDSYYELYRYTFLASVTIMFRWVVLILRLWVELLGD